MPLLLLLVVGELVARVVLPAPEEVRFEGREGVLMRAHPTRMWSLRPGEVEGFGVTYGVDDDGLRRCPGGEGPRILTLGDSSIFGHGLEDEDTLHGRLQAALADRGVASEACTVGIPGYSTEQTLLLMDELGWDLQPDLLVVGNLWSDNNVDGFVDADWLAALRSPAQRVENALSYSRLWTSVRPKPPEHSLHIGWIRTPDVQGHRRVPLTDYARNLDRIVSEAAERGVGAVFLAPCNRYKLEGEVPDAQWDDYFDAMQRVAAHRSVPVVEALPALQAAGIAVDEAFLDQMHPTGAANGLYADALADALVEAGWPAQPLLADLDVAPFSEQLSDAWWK